MWILTEAPKGSAFYDSQSLTGNKTLISDTCETVIYARMQGMDGHRIVALRGRDSFLIGPALARGAATDINAQLLDIARQLNAIILS
jgi:hypothetical protein